MEFNSIHKILRDIIGPSVSDDTPIRILVYHRYGVEPIGVDETLKTLREAFPLNNITPHKCKGNVELHYIYDESTDGETSDGYHAIKNSGNGDFIKVYYCPRCGKGL